MPKKVHIHIHKTADAVEKDPRAVQAKRAAIAAIKSAQDKCEELRSSLLDTDDRNETRSAESYLRNALGKLNEVVSA